jgi:hypothetical protein
MYTVSAGLDAAGTSVSGINIIFWVLVTAHGPSVISPAAE